VDGILRYGHARLPARAANIIRRHTPVVLRRWRRRLAEAIVELSDSVITIEANRSLYGHYLEGLGVEIGALHSPLRIPHPRARVLYVDYKTPAQLRRDYPELDRIAPVDLITPGATLAAIAPHSLDFIIANHVIEHLPDPIGSLLCWHEKLRPHGLLFMAYPVAAHCPDKVRKITPVAHFFDDHARRIETPRDEHLLAFVHAWNPAYFRQPDEVRSLLEYMWRHDLYELDERAWSLVRDDRATIQRLLGEREKHEIHHHAFTYESMKGLFERLNATSAEGFQLVDLSLTKGCLSEHIFVLRAARGPEVAFMDAAGRAAETREHWLEKVIAAKEAYIRDQHRILDERYALIVEQSKRLAENASAPRRWLRR
jgi:SAM-dependent methyltransferase